MTESGLNISMIFGGGADAEQNVLESEGMWSHQNETQYPSETQKIVK